MVGLGTKIIFIGPDCGGKSTLSGLVSEALNIPVVSHRKPESDLDLLASVAVDAMIARERYSPRAYTPDPIFIREQWPFPVDIIYQRTMTDKSSILVPLIEVLGQAYNEAGVIFVYVTASEEELVKRFEARGDELWDIEQIKSVASDYERSYEQNEFGLHMIKVDTTDRIPSVQVLQVLQDIADMKNEIGGMRV